jgi:thiamine biosynthesis lipoprotein
MKKILIIATFFGLLIQFNTNIKASTTETFYISAMYTDISVTLYDGATSEQIDKITEIFKTYDHLAHNFDGPNLSHSNPLYHKNNIVSINEKAGIEPVIVDPLLYDMIKTGLALYDETEGYFNPAMGQVIDIWKDLILSEYINQEIPQSLFEDTMALIASYEGSINPDDIILNDTDKSVYISNPDLKLDLGAYAKGYATELVKEYLIEQNVEHYIVNTGNSTISLGTHPDDGEIDRPLSIRILDPLNLYQNGTAGLLYVRNKSVSTSGNNIQFVTYQGKRYHHIISPFELVPMDYYHSVTLLGDDAGILDALSTALFNMPLEDAKVLLDHFDVEGLFYMQDGSIETYNMTSKFEQGDLIEERTDLSTLYFILGAVILLGGGTVITLSLLEKKKPKAVNDDVKEEA